MIRRILLVVAILLITTSGYAADVIPVVSFMSGTNLNLEQNAIEYDLKLGAQIGKTEPGFVALWSDDVESEWNALGVYIQQELISEPNSLLIGKVSLGAQATIDLNEGDNGMYGFYLSKITNLYGIDVNTEFHYRHFEEAIADRTGNEDGNNQWKIVVGPKFKF